MTDLVPRAADDLDVVAQRIQDDPNLLVIPTGVVIDLRDPNQVADAIVQVREATDALIEMRKFMEAVLRLEATRQGTKTLHLAAADAEITGGRRTEYDAPALEEHLARAGMPLERIQEIVTPVVTYKVNALKLKHAAAANPAYRQAMEAASSTVEAPWRVTVKGRR